MKFDQIEYFLRVAEEGSLSEGATALGIKQSEVKEAIKELEKEWGWKLFDTQNYELQLTEEGVVSYREMKTVQLTYKEGLKIMHEENANEELRIGYTPSIATVVLKKAIDHYSNKNPNIKIKLQSLSTNEMRAGIDEGKLDVILGMEFNSEGIQWETLDKRAQNVFINKDHSFNNIKELSPEDLNQQRLLMLTRSENPQYWNTILDFFSKKEINAKVAGEFDGVGNLIEALKAGLGVAILPTTITLEAERNLVSKSLKGGIPAIKIGIGYKNKGQTAQHVNEFIQSSIETAKIPISDYKVEKEPEEVKF